MKICIFTGPTLQPREVEAELPQAEVLPPVSQGDVYRASLLRPDVIGIIDGTFERLPAVWHKEILWAMSQGIHVFGSSSMGALRAAELAPFGMEGVGWIFEAYRDEVLEDDDEVAVAHASADHEYESGSDPMVNLRRTFSQAAAQGVVSHEAERALVKAAKRLFYPERSYARVLSEAEMSGVPAPELDALRSWLPAGRIDQKRLDAVAMLRAIRERVDAGLSPKRTGFHFEYTDFWDRARLLATEPTAAHPDPPLEMTARRLALLRYLAAREADRAGMQVPEETLADLVQAFAEESGLVDLAETGLSAGAFAGLMREEAMLRWVEDRSELEIVSRLKDLQELLARRAPASPPPP